MASTDFIKELYVSHGLGEWYTKNLEGKSDNLIVQTFNKHVQDGTINIPKGTLGDGKAPKALVDRIRDNLSEASDATPSYYGIDNLTFEEAIERASTSFTVDTDKDLEEVYHDGEAPVEPEDIFVGGGAIAGPGMTPSPVLGSPPIKPLTPDEIASVSMPASNLAETYYGVTPTTPSVEMQQVVEPLNYEDGIARLLDLGINVQFLGLSSPGYPLGYKERQVGGEFEKDKYGQYPVYLPDMSDSLFGDYISGGKFIETVQRKLVDAEYLTSEFTPGRWDTATKTAVEAAMMIHNQDGRVPNVPEIAGALMDFYNIDSGRDATLYGFTGERAALIRDFFINELDVDAEEINQQRIADLSIEAPTFDTESATYQILNVVQQNHGGYGIKYDNIRNATQLVNSLMKQVSLDSKIKEKESVAASKAAAFAGIDKAQQIRELRESNPNLNDEQLKALHPEVFQYEISEVVGELGPMGEDPQNAYRTSLFNNRLQMAVERLLQPEMELDEKRAAINNASQNFYKSTRNARQSITGGASLDRGIST